MTDPWQALAYLNISGRQPAILSGWDCKLLLFSGCDQRQKKTKHLNSVFCVNSRWKTNRLEAVSNVIDVVTTSQMCHRQRDTLSSVFACLSLCVLGGRGRGYESSGTGWESPLSPPGGTPSPPTCPSSPSPITPWETSVPHSSLSVTWVYQSVTTVWYCLKGSIHPHHKKKNNIFSPLPVVVWSHLWIVVVLFADVMKYNRCLTNTHRNYVFIALKKKPEKTQLQHFFPGTISRAIHPVFPVKADTSFKVSCLIKSQLIKLKLWNSCRRKFDLPNLSPK